MAMSTAQLDAKYQLRVFGDPVLSTVCAPVGQETSADELVEIIEAMRKCKLQNDGVGLAAPQIGVPRRIVLVRNDVLINPVVYWVSEVTDSAIEGCLSYPGIGAKVSRPISAKAKYVDERGVERDRQFTYFESRILLHETDHLEGICRVGDEWHKRLAAYAAAKTDEQVRRPTLAGSAKCS